MRLNYGITFLLLAAIQLLICNYLNFSAYITISLLPVLILCFPTRFSTLSAMLVAFATGLATDLLAEGTIGLNVFALLPVAAVRRTLCDWIFGQEISLLDEDISIRKFGALKMTFAISVAYAVFLLFYIAADGGPARPILFNLIRFGCSLIPGVLISLLAARVLDPYGGR